MKIITRFMLLAISILGIVSCKKEKTESYKLFFGTEKNSYAGSYVLYVDDIKIGSIPLFAPERTFDPVIGDTVDLYRYNSDWLLAHGALQYNVSSGSHQVSLKDGNGQLVGQVTINASKDFEIVHYLPQFPEIGYSGNVLFMNWK